MNTDSIPLLQVDQVKKSFKDTEAVKGISLKVQKGEFIALLGPNGAGKTTLVEMIEGIQQPSSGQIHIKGQSWRSSAKSLRRIIGLSLQETNFIEKLKVKETLDLFGSFYGASDSRIQEVLEIISLKSKKDSYVDNLSGGQKQRLALGLALLNNPEILLLDEPTTGLDPVSRRQIWAILMKLKKTSDMALILTTHYMEEAEYLCDNIIILDQGKILVQGPLEELHKDHGSTELLEFTLAGSDKEFNLPAEGRCSEPVFKEKNKSWEVEVTSIARYLPLFLEYLNKNNLTLGSMQSRKKNLDDLFISLTGRHLTD